jgi:hypothetical protein
VSVIFRTRSLSMQIDDDGAGIDPALLRSHTIPGLRSPATRRSTWPAGNWNERDSTLPRTAYSSGLPASIRKAAPAGMINSVCGDSAMAGPSPTSMRPCPDRL